MKISELRLKTYQELLTDLAALKREKMNQRFIKAARESVAPARIKFVRKSIAKIETVLNEIKNKGVVNA